MDKEIVKNENGENSEDINDLKGFFPEEYDLDPSELIEKPDIDSFDNAESSSMWNEGTDSDIPDIESVTATDNINTSDSDYTEKIMKEIATEDSSETNRKRNKKQFALDVYDIIEMFTICTICIILIFSFVGRLTIVDGDSMNDTLLNGQFLVITNFAYEPKQGDIVVLQDTSLEYYLLKKPLIKRVIATSGQTVDISHSGVVTITDTDGSTYVLEEKYTKNEPYLAGAGHYEVPNGCIFVMGDNRNGSTDSRDYRVSYVDERCVIGKAIFRLLPFENAGEIY